MDVAKDNGGGHELPDTLMTDLSTAQMTETSPQSPSYRFNGIDDASVASKSEHTEAGAVSETGTDNATKTSQAMKKKKGTAAVLKAPKRAKAVGGKKSKPTTKKKDNTADGSNAGGDSGGDSDEVAEDSDSGPYCICRGPDNHRFMIACDRCEDWFHGECINMDKYTGENLVQRYICPNCSDGRKYVTRYKKTCGLPGCQKPARIYVASVEAKSGAAKDSDSVFCSDEHGHMWWEQQVATLPRSKPGNWGAAITQEEFVGLLNGGPLEKSAADEDDRWRLGDDPFGEISSYTSTYELL
jgi:COMPASS component SPP1